MIRIKFNILIGMLCFLLTSCFIDSENNSEKSANGQVDVTFSVTLPLPETVNSRAGMPHSDTDIETVDVLVFDQHTRFMERIEVNAFDLVTTGSGVKFSIRLDATSDMRTIHLVANGRTAGDGDRVNFQDIPVGALESEVIPSLHTQVTNAANGLLADIMPLVMWGRTDIHGVSAVSGASAKLLRVAASVQVKVASATSDNGLTGFQIKKIALTGAFKQGYLTPANGFSDVSTPSEARPMNGDIWDLAKSWSNEDAPILYTYERNYSAPEYQGVILSAVYNGEESYYKVALVDANGVPLNIVRNHRYTLTVIKVFGPGYADVNTAVASAPSNAIKVSLTDEDKDFPCLVADGQHLMGLSNNSLDVYGQLTAAQLGTVYSSRGIAPVLTIPEDCDWLVGTRVRDLGDNKYMVTSDFVRTEQSRSTTLTLTCDNLSQTMQVNWEPSVSGNKDGDSYVITLFGGLDKNWTASIVADESNAKGVFLSPTVSNPAGFTPATGSGPADMATSLSSKYARNAYLHVAANETGRGTVKVSTSINGVAISRRVVIWAR